MKQVSYTAYTRPTLLEQRFAEIERNLPVLFSNHCWLSAADCQRNARVPKIKGPKTF